MNFNANSIISGATVNMVMHRLLHNFMHCLDYIDPAPPPTGEANDKHVYIHNERENIFTRIQQPETAVSAELLNLTSCFCRTAKTGSGKICAYRSCPLITHMMQIIIWNLD